MGSSSRTRSANQGGTDLFRVRTYDRGRCGDMALPTVRVTARLGVARPVRPHDDRYRATGNVAVLAIVSGLRRTGGDPARAHDVARADDPGWGRRPGQAGGGA